MAGWRAGSGVVLVTTIVPLSRAEVNDCIRRWHRHHRPIRQHPFSCGVSIDGILVGSATVERPKARALCDGLTFEVSRVSIEPSGERVRNVASRLYAAVRRAALALGYLRGVTYTRADEGGGSLIASGWHRAAETRPATWEGRRERWHGARFLPGMGDAASESVARVRWETGPGCRCSACAGGAE